jgi:hypothetical protein
MFLFGYKSYIFLMVKLYTVLIKYRVDKDIHVGKLYAKCIAFHVDTVHKCLITCSFVRHTHLTGYCRQQLYDASLYVKHKLFVMYIPGYHV